MRRQAFLTRSAGETRRLGAKISWTLSKTAHKRYALVIGLTGNLGSGKTTFLQGFARGLGVKAKIKSPTFLLMRSWPAKRGLEFWHIDCYRIDRVSEFRKLGIEQIFKDPRHVVAVEWAERIKSLLPRNTIWIYFQHGKKANERIISIMH